MSRDSGFTLIEIVVVVAIVAILAALAVQNYWMFKVNAYDSTAASDTRNVAPAAELAASEGLSLVIPVSDPNGGPVPELPGVVISPGVIGTIEIGANTYTIELTHTGGALEYRLDSTAGWTVVVP